MDKTTVWHEPERLELFIFGGTGDLSVRKLLPALYMAHLHGNLPPSSRIIALGRHDWSRDQYHRFVEDKAREFVDSAALDVKAWDEFRSIIDYVSLDAAKQADYEALARASAPNATRVFYLAMAPSLFSVTCEHLAAVGLVDDNARVVLEKPLGTNLASAKAINDSVATHFAESQTYRIDHYLGKETVQNLTVLRFGNAIFGPLWQAPYIKSVQITVAETVGVGSRAEFYDQTGAMRDMVQNHLLQLLCMVAMEPPVSMEADAVRDEKLKVLRSLRPMSVADIARDTVRGQYMSGAVGGERVRGYLDEDGVPANSDTETFVALRIAINNWRWANVPFYLRTGKRMRSRQSEIVIEFADLPFSIMPAGAARSSNCLVLKLQPEESIHLRMMAKEPGSGMKMLPVNLNLYLAEAMSGRRAEAYERLLIDVIRGRLTHFMRRDELEAAWKWVEPILEGWSVLGESPRAYNAGTQGPTLSSALLALDGAYWTEET